MRTLEKDREALCRGCPASTEGSAPSARPFRSRAIDLRRVMSISSTMSPTALRSSQAHVSPNSPCLFVCLVCLKCEFQSCHRARVIACHLYPHHHALCYSILADPRGSYLAMPVPVPRVFTWFIPLCHCQFRQSNKKLLFLHRKLFRLAPMMHT